LLFNNLHFNKYIINKLILNVMKLIYVTPDLLLNIIPLFYESEIDYLRDGQIKCMPMHPTIPSVITPPFMNPYL
jgi:hypothetical protein